MGLGRSGLMACSAAADPFEVDRRNRKPNPDTSSSERPDQPCDSRDDGQLPRNLQLDRTSTDMPESWQFLTKDGKHRQTVIDPCELTVRSRIVCKRPACLTHPKIIFSADLASAQLRRRPSDKIDEKRHTRTAPWGLEARRRVTHKQLTRPGSNRTGATALLLHPGPA